MTQLELVLQS